MFDFRVLRFAIIVCLACSVLVSAAAVGLRDRQQENLRLDIRKNILKSVGLYDDEATQAELNATYEEKIVGLVLHPDGRVAEGRVPGDVNPDLEPELMILYQRLDEGMVTAYTFPVVGKGLWSTLYGYLALEADLNTVRGLSFYAHKETPGLGGEIEKPWFQDSFVGKEIRNDAGEFVSVTVVKGKAADRYRGSELKHYVDGISGATITSRGVTELVKTGLLRYEPYFSQLRAGQGRTS